VRVAVLAVGRLKAGPERELCDRYLDRAAKAGRSLGFRGFSVHEVPEGRATRPEQRIAAEGQALLGALGEGVRPICLDAAGELLDSAEFAERLRSVLVSGRPGVTFAIGGPDGLAGSLLELSDGRIAFGRVTWPHQLARILLAEQLYRAMTILSGHPYHRA
jgi:23S rRNA (pseudouridine1915-N3)-methyltransferase